MREFGENLIRDLKFELKRRCYHETLWNTAVRNGKIDFEEIC